ncbi:MAG: hypothetical protein CHACPFDD_00805 [Phycisphaerae bacterium]|nr:hypothetical protein [Phycisphaerae bacterium]
MKRRTSKWLGMLAAFAAGTVCQIVPTGCGNFAGQFALQAFDFCSVLNCEGSTFFNFCTPVVLLVDCL